MYMNLLLVRNLPRFCKDTVLWRWTASTGCALPAFFHPGPSDRTSMTWCQTSVWMLLLLAISLFERGRSPKVELLTRVWDHAKSRFCYGFRMLTLWWTDGTSFLPVNSVILSSEHAQKKMSENLFWDKCFAGYRQRKLSMKKGTEAMKELLEAIRLANIHADYVLFDFCFLATKTINESKASDMMWSQWQSDHPNWNLS